MITEYYKAVGITCEDRIVNGVVQGVQEADRPIEALLLAAIGTASTSTESMALRDVLGGASDPRWLAYLVSKQVPIIESRNDRYLRDVVTLLVKLFYTAKFIDNANGKIAVFDGTLLQEAKGAVDRILGDLPDPE